MKNFDAVIATFREHLTAHFAWRIEPKRWEGINDLFRERMRVQNFADPEVYLDWLLANPQHAEWQVWVDHLTVRETYFFRNKAQFEFLRDTIVPLYQNAHGTWRWTDDGAVLPELRILSAGCSSGEEPYSIAMMLAEAITYLRTWKIQIEAFDISTSRLNQARSGRFVLTDRMRDSLATMDSGLLDRYFDAAERPNPTLRIVDDSPASVRGDEIRVIKPHLRNLITFRQVNLKSWFDTPASFLPRYHVIFCRNVMIYFGMDDQARLINLLDRMLHPGGFLMMGDAETLHMYSHNFQSVEANAGLIYRKPVNNESEPPVFSNSLQKKV